jgi:DNA-binding FrmR family transcriptional regulator
MQVDGLLELKQALETMFSRIETGEDILEQLEQINALHQALDPTAPKMLRHYLERKSYTKALALLAEVTRS